MKHKARFLKIKKLMELAKIGQGCAYHYIAGTRPVPFQKAKKFNAILGGGTDLWQERGEQNVKTDLFDRATIESMERGLKSFLGE